MAQCSPDRTDQLIFRRIALPLPTYETSRSSSAGIFITQVKPRDRTNALLLKVKAIRIALVFLEPAVMSAVMLERCRKTNARRRSSAAVEINK
jgi:hypothetical protein